MCRNSGESDAVVWSEYSSEIQLLFFADRWKTSVLPTVNRGSRRVLGDRDRRLASLITFTKYVQRRVFCIAGISKLQPTGQIWPEKSFHLGREAISSGPMILPIMSEWYIYETFVLFIHFVLRQTTTGQSLECHLPVPVRWHDGKC